MRPTNTWLAHLGLAGACLLWFPGSPSATASGPGVPGSAPRPATAPATVAPPATAPATAAPPATAPATAVPPATIAPPAGAPAAFPAPPGGAPATITPPANLTPPPTVPNNTPPPAFPGADAPAPGGGGKAVAGNGNFRTPSGAVTAFLAALKARDLDALAEATALHAETEAVPRNQKLFTAILRGEIAKDELDELAKKLDGYKIIDQNDPKSSGRQGIILSKPEKNGAQLIRTITTRHEKKGWKVVDISGAGKIDKPMLPIPGMRRGGAIQTRRR